MAAGDRLFYFPPRHVYGRPETYGLTYESVRFSSTDNVTLHGWFFPAVGGPIGTVVHCHGNAGNITGHFENVRWLPAQGWNLFCFDYRGYGESAGRPTRTGTIADAHAAIDYVRARSDVDADRVVVLGQSLGGAIAIVVAAQSPSVRALAIEGTFSNYRTEARFVGRQNLLIAPVAGALARVLVSEGYDPIDWVGRIAPRPTLFVCGTDDRVVDYRQTVALHEAAGEPKELIVIEGGGHTDSMSSLQARERFVQFFERSLNRTPA